LLSRSERAQQKVGSHDFWNAEDTQTEMTQFLKNVALTGGALTLLALGGADWPLALETGLF